MEFVNNHVLNVRAFAGFRAHFFPFLGALEKDKISGHDMVGTAACSALMLGCRGLCVADIKSAPWQISCRSSKLRLRHQSSDLCGSDSGTIE